MDLLTVGGGIFAILSFVHFISDWVFQTNDMARRKSDESPFLLVAHCAIYTITYVPLLAWMFKWDWSITVSASIVLFISHGTIDTYTPTWLWARYVRRPPEMKNDPVTGFTEWIKTPFGMIITLCVDQIMHLGFLIPITMMIVASDLNNVSLAKLIGHLSLWTAVAMAAISVITIKSEWRHESQQLTDDDDVRSTMPSQHDE